VVCLGGCPLLPPVLMLVAPCKQTHPSLLAAAAAATADVTTTDPCARGMIALRSSYAPTRPPAHPPARPLPPPPTTTTASPHPSTPPAGSSSSLYSSGVTGHGGFCGAPGGLPPTGNMSVTSSPPGAINSDHDRAQPCRMSACAHSGGSSSGRSSGRSSSSGSRQQTYCSSDKKGYECQQLTTRSDQLRP
jgi:hypothetical protein